MIKTRWIAAFAAMSFFTLLGCQSEESPAAATEASTKETGALAFRLSPQSVQYLRTEAFYVRYTITGPGMDTMIGDVFPDTSATILWNVPCGTRVIELRANNSQGNPVWYGADTVFVKQGEATYAHITLKKLAGPTGTVVLDISLDSSDPALPALNPPFDTVWEAPVTYSSAYLSGTRTDCHLPQWGGPGDSVFVRCNRITYVPIPGDTIWVDTVVHFPVRDTSKGCILLGKIDTSYVGDSLQLRAHRKCYHYTYVPVKPDTLWRDTTVHTSSLDGQTWCRPAPRNALNKECLTGRYKSMSDDLPFSQWFYDFYETTALCETIFWGNVVPMGVVEPCPTDSIP